MKRGRLQLLSVGLALVATPSRGAHEIRNGLPASGSPTTESGVFAAEPVALSGRAMGTTWSVKFIVPADTEIDAELARQRVAARLEELEQQFSTYRPSSDLSRFNANASTEWIPAPADLARVAAESRRISALSGGAFDPTVLPLLRLWGIGGAPRPDRPPTEAALTAARAAVDWTRLEARLSPPALRKARGDVAADFSSMAKGFAADAVSELLAALGAPNHLVQIGGDMKAAGGGIDGRGWRVGIEEPRGDMAAVARVVVLRGHALSTSGAQRNFVEIGGRRIGHVMDARTGRPAGGGLVSVSVVHETCATSSALATALFALGLDEGFALAERHGLACVFLVRDDEAIVARPTRAFAVVSGR